jgi:hypothetical protein
MAVLWMFRKPSLCRHVHRELWRSVLLGHWFHSVLYANERYFWTLGL